MRYNDGKDIYVFIEQRNQVLVDGSLELIAEAKKLQASRDFNDKVVGVLLGQNVMDLAQEVIYHGADHVIVCDDAHLKNYETHQYTDVLTQIIKDKHPEIFLFSGTVNGRDLAPRLSARVHTGLTADATQISYDDEDLNSHTLLITRPAFGGNLYATIICENHKPQMATIREHVFDKLTRDESLTGTIEYFVYPHQTYDAIKILETVSKKEQTFDLSKANIIVSAGRGVSHCLEAVKEVAHRVGGTLGASRALVDAGVITKDHQVGQTGKTVKPTIYLACGISGAVQHTAGMEKSDYIIAINTDEQAPIFDVADLGIIGDAKEILPILSQKLNAQNK